jgi:hypothetical protein
VIECKPLLLGSGAFLILRDTVNLVTNLIK